MTGSLMTDYYYSWLTSTYSKRYFPQFTRTFLVHIDILKSLSILFYRLLSIYMLTLFPLLNVIDHVIFVACLSFLQYCPHLNRQ